MKKYSIVFDNKCAVCNTSVKTFQKLGFLESIQAIELDKFRENNLACNVNPVRACNEMAVINNESLEVSYGYDGYVNLLGVRFKRLSKFMSVKTNELRSSGGMTHALENLSRSKMWRRSCL